MAKHERIYKQLTEREMRNAITKADRRINEAIATLEMIKNDFIDKLADKSKTFSTVRAYENLSLHSEIAKAAFD